MGRGSFQFTYFYVGRSHVTGHNQMFSSSLLLSLLSSSLLETEGCA